MIDLPLNQSPAWLKLQHKAERMRAFRISELFLRDEKRAEKLSWRSDYLTLQLANQALDESLLHLLIKLAEERDCAHGIEQLFSHASVNFTEQRAALHMAARFSTPKAPSAETESTITLQRMEKFVSRFHAGKIIGTTKSPLKEVVHLGIGGSDLGARLVIAALTEGRAAIVPIRFVSGLDTAELNEVLSGINPEETLFIIASKSFTTEETMINAEHARSWLKKRLGQKDVNCHFAAITSNRAAAIRFGVDSDHILTMPRFIGGRFSVWSAMGLPVMLAIGHEAFRRFLHGGKTMDRHFVTAPFFQNLPVLLALTSLWNHQFLEIESLAVLPYCYGLRGLPSYLQQLEMESNGKSVTRTGQPVAWQTAPIIWGGVGSNSQHAFHQLLYQGTRRVALEFIVVTEKKNNHHTLLEHATGQATMLMQGQNLGEVTAYLEQQELSPEEIERLAPHMISPGNQPSTTVLLDRLTPESLGELLALYEHKVFMLGWLWGINSFDQFGVELGKRMLQKMRK